MTCCLENKRNHPLCSIDYFFLVFQGIYRLFLRIGLYKNNQFKERLGYIACSSISLLDYYKNNRSLTCFLFSFLVHLFTGKDRKLNAMAFMVSKDNENESTEAFYWRCP